MTAPFVYNGAMIGNVFLTYVEQVLAATLQTGDSQGTTARPKLDDKAFEAFIRARRPVSPIWSMSGLNGYLTALIIGPKFIDPRQWIPELTGPEALNLPMGNDRASGRADHRCGIQPDIGKPR